MAETISALAAFARTDPLLSFILVCASYYAITAPFRFGFRAWNRYCRMRNIRDHGWPPPHLDADGDYKESSK